MTVLEPCPNQIAVVAVIVTFRTVVGYSLDKELKEMEPPEEPKGELA